MANVKISNLPAAATIASLNDLLPAVEDVAGTPDTVKLTYQQLFDAFSVLPSTTPTFGDGGIAFTDNTNTWQTGWQEVFDLISDLPQVTTQAHSLDKLPFYSENDSNAAWQTYQNFYGSINEIPGGPIDGNFLDRIVFYSSTDTVAYRATFLEMWESMVNFSPLGAVGDGDQFVVMSTGGTPSLAFSEDLATYILGKDIWSASERIVRRVMFTTGATAVLMGETASTSGTGSATAHAVSATNPQGATYTTGAVNGNIFGWTSVAQHVTSVGLVFEFVVTAPETTNVRYLIGIANNAIGSIGGSDTPGTAFHCALLRWSTGVPDTNLQFITGNASAQTVTDLGIAKPADKFRMTLVFRASGATVDVYINGTLRATISSATMPSTSTALQMTGGCTTLTGAGKVTRMYEMASSSDY